MPATILECPVLRPTLKEIEGCSFEEYITKHERVILSRGVCKIVAPDGWAPCSSGKYSHLNFEITKPIRQNAIGNRGVFRMVYTEEKSLSNRELQASEAAKAAEQQRCSAEHAQRSGTNDVERNFWKNLSLHPPLYGADVLGSLFDEKLKGLNLKHLDTLLTTVLEENGCELPGVTKPYLYFGTSRSVFAWHTEDLDLYSVNYLHFGAPKQWYVVPPEHRQRFEQVMRSLAPGLFMQCSQFLRHKELLVSPQLLDQHMIPYVKMTQQPREFVINAPGAYHAGFNWGYNAAESVNFATKKWVPVGARAGVCKCNSDSVTIDMRLFRHLVPRKLLPKDIWEDTSSEGEGSSEAGSDSEEEGDEEEEEEEEEEEGEDSAAGEEEQPPPKRRRPNASSRACRPATPAPAPPKPPAPRSTNNSKRAASPTPRAARAAARTAAHSNTRRHHPHTVPKHTRSNSSRGSGPRLAHARSTARARTPPASTGTRRASQQAGEGARGGSALMARLVGSPSRTGSTRAAARQAQGESSNGKATSAAARKGQDATPATRRANPSGPQKAAVPAAATAAATATAASLQAKASAPAQTATESVPVRSSPRTKRTTASQPSAPSPAQQTAGNSHQPAPQAHTLTMQPTPRTARISLARAQTQKLTPDASAAAAPAAATAARQPILNHHTTSSPAVPRLSSRCKGSAVGFMSAQASNLAKNVTGTKRQRGAAGDPPAFTGAATQKGGGGSPAAAKANGIQANAATAAAAVPAPATGRGGTVGAAAAAAAGAAGPGPRPRSSARQEARTASAAAKSVQASAPHNKAPQRTHPLQLKQVKHRVHASGGGSSSSGGGGGVGGSGRRNRDDGLGWWVQLPQSATKPRTLSTRPHKKPAGPAHDPSNGANTQANTLTHGAAWGLGDQQHVRSALQGSCPDGVSQGRAEGPPLGAAGGFGGQDQAPHGLQGPSSEFPVQGQAEGPPLGAAGGFGGQDQAAHGLPDLPGGTAQQAQQEIVHSRQDLADGRHDLAGEGKSWQTADKTWQGYGRHDLAGEMTEPGQQAMVRVLQGVSGGAAPQGRQATVRSLQGPSPEAAAQGQAEGRALGAAWGLGGQQQQAAHGLQSLPGETTQQAQQVMVQGQQGWAEAAAQYALTRTHVPSQQPLFYAALPTAHTHLGLRVRSLAALGSSPVQSGGLGHVELHPGQSLHCPPLFADLQGPSAQQQGVLQPQQHQHQLAEQQQHSLSEHQCQHPLSEQQQQQQQPQLQHPLLAQQEQQHANDAADSSGTSAATAQLHQEQKVLMWGQIGEGGSRSRSSQGMGGDGLREAEGMGPRGDSAERAGTKRNRRGVPKKGGVSEEGEGSGRGLLFLQHPPSRRPRTLHTRARANVVVLRHHVRMGRGDEGERVPPPPMRPHQASSLFSAVLKSGGQRTAAVAAARALGMAPSEPQERLPVDRAPGTVRAQRNIKPTWKFLD